MISENLSDFISPAFQKNNIPVVFATDENWGIFLSVVIKSILETSSESNNYDLIVLEEQLSEDVKKKLQFVIKDKSNFSLRFINMTPYLNNIGRELFPEKREWTIATYYRLFIPVIFQNYEKVIYLDTDVILLKDISLLYLTDLENNYLAAAVDVAATSLTFHKDFMKKFNLQGEYFNDGILVFNIHNDLDLLPKSIQCLQTHKDLPAVAQDVNNIVCYKKIKKLPLAWNFFNYEDPKSWFSRAPFETSYIKEYLALDLTHINLIHYVGCKPWKYPAAKYADLWWNYANQLPFSNAIHEKSYPFQIKHLQKLLKKSEEQRKLIENSFFWKITFPARKFYDFLFLDKE